MTEKEKGRKEKSSHDRVTKVAPFQSPPFNNLHEVKERGQRE